MSTLGPTRWVLTGGSGFLGSSLLRVLQPEDGEVVVVDRHAPRWPVSHMSVQYVQEDTSRINAYRPQITPGSVVVHMASSSYPGKAEKNVETDIQENVLGAVRLANACADAGAAALLFFSTGGALYGQQERLPIPEDAPPRPKSAYGVMKLSIEHYLRVIHELRGLPVAMVRIGNPFGPWHNGKGQGIINVALAHMQRQVPIELWGDGTQTRDYLFAEDAMRAVRSIGREFRDGCEAFNIGTGEERSLTQVFQTLQEVTGVAPQIQFLPERPVDVERNALDCRKIRERFGWTPQVPFAEGVRRTWAWIQTQPH